MSVSAIVCAMLGLAAILCFRDACRLYLEQDGHDSTDVTGLWIWSAAIGAVLMIGAIGVAAFALVP